MSRSDLNQSNGLTEAAPGRHVPLFPFEVSDTGRVTAPNDVARRTAAAILYVARIVDVAGASLGAGPIKAVEVFGSETAYAAVTMDRDRPIHILGLLDLQGAPPEDLRAQLERQGRR